MNKFQSTGKFRTKVLITVTTVYQTKLNNDFSVELAEMVVEAEIFPSVLTCLKVSLTRNAILVTNLQLRTTIPK